MGFKEFQKNLPVFSIGVVTKITQLSARQIRYYEEKKLFTPKRTEGNTRLFSLNDIDSLLTIKELLNKGFNIKAIDKLYIMIYLLVLMVYLENALLDVVIYQGFTIIKKINFNTSFYIKLRRYNG